MRYCIARYADDIYSVVSGFNDVATFITTLPSGVISIETDVTKQEMIDFVRPQIADCIRNNVPDIKMQDELISKITFDGLLDLARALHAYRSQELFDCSQLIYLIDRI